MLVELITTSLTLGVHSTLTTMMHSLLNGLNHSPLLVPMDLLLRGQTVCGSLSLFHSHHSLSLSSTHPGSGTFTNPNNPFEPFFGKAPKPITQSPYTRENLDLPDAYVGSNYYLSQVLITNITKQEQFWVTEVLPWQKSEDKDSLEWDELNFNDHMLNRRPEESTSRLLSFERTENRAAFVSYGIAMILESGFYKTQSGKMFYSLHLTQIMNATVETACMGAALALLNAKPPSTFFNERNDMGLDHDAFARTLSAEVDMFGVLHKTK